jgi:hypothetical protein
VECAADYTLTGSLGWVSGAPVSIGDLSLKELRALAQQRLGSKAAELKTRQELVDAIEATERKKKAPRLMVSLAAPLPEPLPVVPVLPVKELPPAPVIWTAEAPLPQITTRPLEEAFPVSVPTWTTEGPPRKVAPPMAPDRSRTEPVGGGAGPQSSGGARAEAAARVSGEAQSSNAVRAEPFAPAAPVSGEPQSSAGRGAKPVPIAARVSGDPQSSSRLANLDGPDAVIGAPQISDAPTAVSGAPELSGGARAVSAAAMVADEPPSSADARTEPVVPERRGSPEFSTDEELSPAAIITRHFFIRPDRPRLPVAYEDNRVLTFSRDPKSVYAVWDFAPAQFDQARAEGRVVTEAGGVVQAFAVAGPAGSVFLEALPPGVPLKIEVRGGPELVGESGWVNLPQSRVPRVATASAEAERSEDRPNAPSSLV